MTRVHPTTRSGATPLASSALGTGTTDQVSYRKTDALGVKDGRDVYIEVGYWSGSACATWTLTVQGNTGTGSGCP